MPFSNDANFGKANDAEDQETMKRVNEELTIDELYKLHKMLKQAQSEESSDPNSQSIHKISSVIIDSIGSSAIKIIYQRMWDAQKVVRKLAASILSKL